MSYITFHDISQWQGDYNMNDGCPMIAIKMGGGDAGLYFDSQANANYNKADAAGKVIIGYWFYGGGTPEAEADKFIEAMSPVAENDIFAIDVERSTGWSPVADPGAVVKVAAFAQRLHDRIGVWPIMYINTSTVTSKDWSPVLNNCGLWIADYRFTPDQDVPCGHPYIIHQYTSTPLDTDACFIPLDTIKQYGYHKPVTPTPAPQPAPQPTPAPQPEPTPAPVPPAPAPEPKPVPTPTPEPKPAPIPKLSLIKKLIAWFKKWLRMTRG